DIQASGSAEPEGRHEGGNPVHADRVGQAIEIDVAGLGYGLDEIHPAVVAALALAVQVGAPGQVKLPRAKTRLVWIHYMIGEAGERNDWFDRRARGVNATHCAVEQRRVDVIFQRTVLGPGDAAAEQ